MLSNYSLHSTAKCVCSRIILPALIYVQYSIPSRSRTMAHQSSPNAPMHELPSPKILHRSLQRRNFGAAHRQMLLMLAVFCVSFSLDSAHVQSSLAAEPSYAITATVSRRQPFEKNTCWFAQNCTAPRPITAAKVSTHNTRYKYYLVNGFGLFDMAHIKHGEEQMSEVLRELPLGRVHLSFIVQKSITTGSQIEIHGIYYVRRNLTPAQQEQAALGIVMDFERTIEQHQAPGSSFAVEDLPSDYLGYFIALHPHWDERQVLALLDVDGSPTGISNVSAQLYRIFRKNREFRPLPYFQTEPANWPKSLQMQIASRPSKLWERVLITVTSDERIWWQKLVDWGIQAYHAVS